jgi:hypothetical protein
MNQHVFLLNPAKFGVPSREEFVSLRIWDLHYHGLMADELAANPRQHEECMVYVDRMGIERVIALDIASDRWDAFSDTRFVDYHREVLERQKDRVSGIIRVDPSDPDRSCEKMEKWVKHGPCIGIKYSGTRTNKAGITCSHPNNDAIIRYAAELGALVYIHTCLKVGGNPRSIDGGNKPGDSTPMDVALLSQRFPDVPLICGHAGTDWELGARTVRRHPNVYLEFAGMDPHAGAVEFAVKELGADRLVWGGHGKTRGYATELAKIIEADIPWRNKKKAFGGNLRRIVAPIFRSKGQNIEI